jgi:hypothetical protein
MLSNGSASWAMGARSNIETSKNRHYMTLKTPDIDAQKPAAAHIKLEFEVGGGLVTGSAKASGYILHWCRFCQALKSLST